MLSIVANLKIRAKAALCFFLGLLCLFASPPFFFFPVILVSFSLLLFIFDSNDGDIVKKAASFFAFSVGYNIANFHWFVSSMFIEFKRYGPLIPISLLIIGAVYASIQLVSMAPFFYLSKNKRPLHVVLLFSLFWFLSEFIRSHFPFNGMPWQNIGTIFACSDEMLQLASIIKIDGCGLIAVFLSLLPFLCHKERKNAKKTVIIATFFLVCVFLFGKWRLSNPTEFRDQYILGLQSNIEINDIMNHDDVVLDRYVTDSQVAKGFDQKNIIAILPESSGGVYGLHHEQYESLIRKLSFMPDNISHVFINALYVDKETNPYQVYNRMSIFDKKKGDFIANHDKAILVPFGEYIPAKAIFSKMFNGRITNEDEVDISPGIKYELINVNGIKIAPTICYESAFFSRIYNKNQKADVIFNVSNDSWFRNTVGPYQHLAISKILAVENNLPVVRVANTGISAIFDKYGRSLILTKFGTKDIVYNKIPK